MMNRIKAIPNYFKPGTFIYAGIFGVALGSGLAGTVYGLRALRVLLFDEEHFRVQSRQRYLEKQHLFFKQLQETQEAHALASLAQEYNPVDTRLPFQKMDDKYRF
jgi:hypothetical protein